VIGDLGNLGNRTRVLAATVRRGFGWERLHGLRERVDDVEVAVAENAALTALLEPHLADLEQEVGALAARHLARRQAWHDRS